MLPKEEVEFVEGFCRLSEAVQMKEVIDSNERSLLSSMSKILRFNEVEVLVAFIPAVFVNALIIEI